MSRKIHKVPPQKNTKLPQKKPPQNLLNDDVERSEKSEQKTAENKAGQGIAAVFADC